ncbi:MAG TPA: chorismate-binding protein [Ktedonobacterales bacterium]|nr:chorismate-binding protein [Ktedonobacterales bacterium]
MATNLVARTPALIPLWREVPADLETPVSAYLKLARGPYCYLLESVEGGERLARYSFVGVEPYMVLTLRGTVAERHWLAGPRAGRRERMACHDPLELIQAELARRPLDPGAEFPGFHGGAVGYLSYELAARFEPRIPVPAHDALGLPEAMLLFSDTLLIFDHVRHSARLLTHIDCAATEGDEPRARAAAERRLDVLERRLHSRRPFSGSPRRAASRGEQRAHDHHVLAQGRPRDVSQFAPSVGAPGCTPSGSVGASGGRPLAATDLSGAGASRLEPEPAYAAAVERAREYIRAGDCFQIVPSRRVARPMTAAPFEVYRALRSINPSPYMFYLSLGDFAVAGASPELLVRVEAGEVAIHPIAGTRRRGVDAAEDAALEAELRADAKEQAEHVMLVDLGRNDVGRVSEPGSVRVTQLLDVERYSHVMHLVSHVTGRLRADLTPFDALRAGFPAGTVSGAPKIRAMQVIAELEGERRGVYAGAVGYFGFDGNLDTCIALRTLVLKDGMAYAQAGGGIVYDSDPVREFAETQSKLRAGLRALEEAEKRCSC